MKNILLYCLLLRTSLLIGQSITVKSTYYYPEFTMNGQYDLNHASFQIDNSIYTVAIISGTSENLNDSAILVKFVNDKYEYVQDLKFPTKFKSLGSVKSIFIIGDNLYFTTSAKKLHIFNKRNRIYEYKESISSSNDYIAYTGPLGYFQKLYLINDTLIYSSDFDELSSKNGCKKMFVGIIDARNLKLMDSLRIPVCGTFLESINGIYPIGFSSDAKRMAYYDVINNRLNIWDMIERRFNKSFQISIDSNFSINADTIAYLSRICDENSTGSSIAWNLRARNVLHSSHVSRLFFLNSETILISIYDKYNFVFKIININTGIVKNIEYQVKLNEDYIHWNKESILFKKNYFYILTINYLIKSQIIEGKERQDWSMKGYKMVHLKYADK